MPLISNKEILDELYARYNRREFVHPDPLEFLYDYVDIRDREIVGLVAASLAYGRVIQILKSVAFVFKRMPSPSRFLRETSLKSLLKIFAGFRHRFTTGEELSMMLFGIKCVIDRHGSLYACFATYLNNDDDTILPALSSFVQELTTATKEGRNSLLPAPAKGSACKRLHLFLRWMVRRDNVDPGGWDSIPASKLIVPVDTHMYSICRELRLTQQRQANIRAATEITTAFRMIAPDDPVKYDFALTRLGIRDDADLRIFLKQCVQNLN
jgi:uncharacterized protein (TIGR02757 family)